MAIKGKQKTLKDVAKVFQTKALQAINPGVPYKPYKKTGSSKAYKTGRLQSAIASSNTVDKMVTRDKDRFSFTFNVAPSGAPYGKFVHYGKKNRGVMEPRPFAEIAAESPEFKVALDQYINTTVVQGKLDAFFEKIDEQMVKAGVKVDTT